MIEVKAPNEYDGGSVPKIFLAGSIEMGSAEPWQQDVVNSFSDMDVIIYNPRRDDWDNTWIQSIDNEPFLTQVEWELCHLRLADIVLMYLQPGTMSPISLLELGLIMDWACVPVVCCPEGFHRKGSVDITCAFFGHSVYDDIASAIEKTREEAEILSGIINDSIIKDCELAL